MKARIIALLLLPFPILGLYLGSYLPYVKARQESVIRQRLLKTHDLRDTFDIFNDALAVPSPVGQGETITNVLYYVSELLLVKSPENGFAMAHEFGKYAESIADQKDIRHQRSVFKIYKTIYQLYGDPSDLKKMEQYLLNMLKINPIFPEALYNLFDTYQRVGDIQKRDAVGCKILQLWPEETRLTGIQCG